MSFQTPYYLSGKSAIRYHQGKAEKHFSSAVTTEVASHFFMPKRPVMQHKGKTTVTTKTLMHGVAGAYGAAGAVHSYKANKLNKQYKKKQEKEFRANQRKKKA